jgi:hypothetical protein
MGRWLWLRACNAVLSPTTHIIAVAVYMPMLAEYVWSLRH